MIITRIRGGLGNQMFSYAFGKYLATRHNDRLVMDFTYLAANNMRQNEIKEFNISGDTLKINPFVMRVFFKVLKMLPKKLFGKELYYKEKRRCYFKKTLLDKKVFILDGYWTCERYFKEIKGIIRKEFTLKNKLNDKNKLMLEKIADTNSVCIHVRRTDRVTDPGSRRAMKPSSEGYYDNAIKLIARKVIRPHFFIMSDDINWVKINFKRDDFPVTYVDINKQEEGYKDFNLMKHCKHFIIANSTVSWWAAWLSENKNKIVIAPKLWFNKNSWKEGDVIPKTWLRVGEEK